MYIYKVTNTSTGEFYFGISKQSKDDFDNTKNLDPMGFFKVYEPNGYGSQNMAVCAKHLIAHSDSLHIIENKAAELSKKYQDVPEFLGLKLHTKSEEHANAVKEVINVTKKRVTPDTSDDLI